MGKIINNKYFRKVVLALIVIFSLLFLSALLTANLTEYSGYSYTHCDKFASNKSILNTTYAHETIRNSSPDDKRISDINLVKNRLTSFYIANANYPVVSSGDWGELKVILEAEELPNDPCFESNEKYQYQYKSDGDGEKYVLKTLLSDTDFHLVIGQHDEDLDGLQLDLWCGEGKFDREYCISN